MPATIKLDHVSIILLEPQIPENIGSGARAMHNMGISRLMLVNPRNYDLSRILTTATGTSADLIEGMQVRDDLMSAIGPFQYLVGTTSRTRANRPALTNSRHIARDLISISQNNMVAILFGPEDRGLSNHQLRYCHTIATVPTAGFSSLNLSHAVMVICYEVYLASKEPSVKTMPRLANKFEVEGMYEHAKTVLTKIGFLNPQNPEHWMLRIRRFCSRLPLKATEVRTIRGICRQMDWYTDQVKKMSEKKKRDSHFSMEIRYLFLLKLQGRTVI